ncbi:MAG: hypothetical protein AAB964_02905 [Patescibacteria group bacterium]
MDDEFKREFLLDDPEEEGVELPETDDDADDEDELDIPDEEI